MLALAWPLGALAHLPPPSSSPFPGCQLCPAQMAFSICLTSSAPWSSSLRKQCSPLCLVCPTLLRQTLQSRLNPPTLHQPSGQPCPFAKGGHMSHKSLPPINEESYLIGKKSLSKKRKEKKRKKESSSTGPGPRQAQPLSPFPLPNTESPK